MTKAIDTLKKHKLKVTPGRLELLSLLQNNKNAVSQSVIQNEFKEMDRVTLYRILGAFQEKGIIHKITDENGDAAPLVLCAQCVVRALANPHAAGSRRWVLPGGAVQQQEQDSQALCRPRVRPAPQAG